MGEIVITEDSDIRWLLLGVDDMVGEMGRKSECD